MNKYVLILLIHLTHPVLHLALASVIWNLPLSSLLAVLLPTAVLNIICGLGLFVLHRGDQKPSFLLYYGIGIFVSAVCIHLLLLFAALFILCFWG